MFQTTNQIFMQNPKYIAKTKSRPQSIPSTIRSAIGSTDGVQRHVWWPHGHLSEVHRDTAPRSQFLQYNSPNSANQDAVRTCCRLLSTKIQQRSLQCDASNSFFIECLVGGFNLSEKYESQLGWLFPIWTNKKMFQTTNQFFIKCTWLHRQRIHSPHSTRNQGPPSQNWYLAKHQRLVCAHGSKSTKDLQHWGLKSCHPWKVPPKKHPWFSGSKRRAQGAATWLRTGVFVQNMAHDM